MEPEIAVVEEKTQEEEQVQKDFIDLEVEGGHGHTSQGTNWVIIIQLAFQCVGVVFGDLGTSPIYVLPATFSNGIKHHDDILGVLSLIIYSILFISLVKYVFVVMSANNDGDGGTFALYALICRYANINLMPNQKAGDRELPNHKSSMTNHVKRASTVKSLLEHSCILKYIVFFMTMIGVSMVIGDGILTPCMSVLSAVEGIKRASNSLTDSTIMWISVVILILLFQLQRFGTDKVGKIFAPVLLLWFAFIAFIGMHNFVKYDPGVIKALNPYYIEQYFNKNKKDAWISLGGILLCLTGSEALFADLGHFNIRSIQISSCMILMPSVFLAYLGQCSYLRQHSEAVGDVFYRSIPESLYWPQFILAVLAAIIASQSLISATFSIVQQCVKLGCFPGIKVVHTSTTCKGQVYLPEVNTFLMGACVGITLGFKNTLKIGNAYGVAVSFVFLVTSSLLIIVMLMIWKTHIAFIILYILTIGLMELVFFSSSLHKFMDGGYLPLGFALVMMVVMFVWTYSNRKRNFYELENKVALATLVELVSDPRIHRVQGIGLFYTHLDEGIPPIFTHYLSSVLALHSILVFVSFKPIPISHVHPRQQFLFHRVQPHELVIFQCVVRIGYKEVRNDDVSFEETLINRLKDFIQEDGEGEQMELTLIDNALRNTGVIHIVGETELKTLKRSAWVEKFIVEYLYSWLSKAARQPQNVFSIPRRRQLKVGMIYEV